nr:hypothetical protein [Tanacetum cinerariifolium]
MDVKSAFLYWKIEEEVYVCQPLGFKDPDIPDRVYKVEKVLYGLHQAPRAWFTEVKTASTPMETQKPLLKDEDGEEVYVYMNRLMIGSLMYLTSSRLDIMFVVCACARYQVNLKCKEQTVVANSITEANYVAASSCCTQVLWIQNQLLDYDEAVHKELGKSLVRDATTASSLEAEQNSGKINKTQSKATPNESSSQGTNSGGGPRCQETIGILLLKLGGEEVFAAAGQNKIVVNITTEELTLAQALEALKTSNPRLDEEAAKRLQVEFDKEARLARKNIVKEQEANIALIEEWNDIQAKIDVDYQLAKKLQAREQEELSDEEKATFFQQLLEKRRENFAAKRPEEKRNKPLTKA